MKNQKEYWSGVGILLYLVKHSRPNVANAARKISKANDGANPATFKKLLNMIKHVLNIKNVGLKMEPARKANKQWEIVCFSDSNYAGDPECRRNISLRCTSLLAFKTPKECDTVKFRG